MKLDYRLINGLEEWKNNQYKITHNFYRLKVYTNRLSSFLQEKINKKIPVNSVVKLNCDEFRQLHNIITESKKFTGLYGPYRVKAFDISCFYIKDKDGLATEDELKYNQTLS